MDINQVNKAQRYSKDVKIDNDLRFILRALLLEREQMLKALESVAMVSGTHVASVKRWRAS